MKQLPMLANILAQPASHAAVLAAHRQDADTVRRCARMLREANGNILLSGMGASLFAAYPAAAELAAHGYSAQGVESAELLHHGAAALHKDDVGVLISRSGGSVEVLALAEAMHAAGMLCIAVTNVRGSALEKACDATLHIGSLADQIIAVQTYTGTVLKLLLLAEEVCGGSGLAGAVESAQPVLTAWIDRCIHASDGWRDVMDGPGALYLLGRGSALATVHEGALLLHETAKTGAIGMSSGQFRHGPVEAVDAAFRGIVFGAPAKTRELDRALLTDLAEMGATMRWVGPGDDAHALAPWPQADSRLAPLFDVVTMQVAAYRLAGWRGITAGEFRYAAEITSAETGFPRFQARRNTEQG